jgi:nicotinamidase-related amidase
MPGKRRGGWKDVPNEGVMPDLIGFYDHYLEKALKGNSSVLATEVPSGEGVTNSLLVIDMQPDFTNPDGAFSVADGILMLPDLVSFIDANMTKFSKIIFSRDTHDAKHCSFMGQKGPFPDHCVVNSPGAALMPELLKYKDEPNVDVIFKGMHPDVDSFGAHKYPSDKYYASRQIGEACCKDPDAKKDGDSSCSDMTGGRYLKDRKKGFADKPFEPASATTFKEIKDQFAAPFSIADLIPDGTKTHNVFVVGLAGDFCCKDTAINIMKTAKADPSIAKGATVNVFVIESLVRYAFLPIAYAPPFVDKAQFKSVKEDKDFSYYVFERLPGDKKRILAQKELTPELNVDDMKYSHFLTDPKGIVADYADAGVKMIMKPPTLAGGRRRTYRRKRKTRGRKTRQSGRR